MTPFTPVKPVVVPPTPTTPTSRFKENKAIAAGGRQTFQTPITCVPAGGTFVVTLKFAEQRRKGNTFVKVTRVDFSAAGKVVKKDKKAPFRQTLRVEVGTEKGSKVSVRARAYIKVKRGKGPKKSIRATVTVCG